MAGTGTGYDLEFACPVAKRNRDPYEPRGIRYAALPEGHDITLTGSARPTKRDGRGHPRKSWTTFHWSCTCGRSGWSSHIDLEEIALRGGDASIVPLEEVLENAPEYDRPRLLKRYGRPDTAYRSYL